jgi:hypothetical protein
MVEPGLYRLVARADAPGWLSPAVFETTIAVTRSNRALPRGRATFFGVQTNLMSEPAADQNLEIDLAREIGVQLLALETPWRLIEPARSAFEFTTLERLVNRITQRDIATMIVLTEPPEWLPADEQGVWDRQAAVCETLAQHLGKRVWAYQALLPDGAPLDATARAGVERIRKRVTAVRPDVEVFPPSQTVAASASNDAPTPRFPLDGGGPLAFETTGDPGAAFSALQTLAEQGNLTWDASHRWLHRAEALNGPGGPHHAVAVLRHYVRAAAEGVGGVIWFDLRDDTNDPRHPEEMKGLVRRDFSPKTPLLGLANAVGMLHGLLYAGPVSGAPEEFASALFIGGKHQVAVIFPQPNRMLPAALAPFQLVPGELAVFDFDRRPQPLLRSSATPLVATPASPLFIILDCERPQTQAKLGLARPWLRVPRTVCCGERCTFRIEIDAARDLRRSYLQLILPPNAPVESDFSARLLRAQAGETLAFDVHLTRVGEPAFERAALTLRVTLEGITFRLPLIVRPLFDVLPIDRAPRITRSSFAIGSLAPGDRRRDRTTGGGPDLHVGYDRRALHVAIALPPGASPQAELDVGIAAEGADGHTEMRTTNAGRRPELHPVYPADPSKAPGWRCRTRTARPSGVQFCHITIPASALSLPRFEEGVRLLLAVRYLEPALEGGPPRVVAEWGTGLGGSRSTAGYQCLRLGAPPAKP